MQTQTDDIYKDAVAKKAEVDTIKSQMKKVMDHCEKEQKENQKLNDKMKEMEKTHKDAALKLHEAF